MTAKFPVHLRAAGMEDKRYTMHSLRGGGAAIDSHNINGTAMDVLIETRGGSSQSWHAGT